MEEPNISINAESNLKTQKENLQTVSRKTKPIVDDFCGNLKNAMMIDIFCNENNNKLQVDKIEGRYPPLLEEMDLNQMDGLLKNKLTPISQEQQAQNQADAKNRLMNLFRQNSLSEDSTDGSPHKEAVRQSEDDSLSSMPSLDDDFDEKTLGDKHSGTLDSLDSRGYSVDDDTNVNDEKLISRNDIRIQNEFEQDIDSQKEKDQLMKNINENVTIMTTRLAKYYAKLTEVQKKLSQQQDKLNENIDDDEEYEVKLEIKDLEKWIKIQNHKILIKTKDIECIHNLIRSIEV